MQSEFAEAIARPVTGALAVYRNTVTRGAVEALRANYPVVEQIIGGEMFEAMAAEYSAASPPRSPVLALYGRDFADWIEDQQWAGDVPYLADVARVERLRVESLFAADAEPVAGLHARSDFAALKLRLHPAARFAWLTTPAMSIWLAHQQPIEVAIEPEWKAEGALFVRPTPFVMHTPRIGRAAHRLLCGIRLGEAAGASIAAAERLYPEENPQAVFSSLANLGVFVAPDIERTTE
jgi:hypothetical protein